MLNSKFRVSRVFALENVIVGCTAASAVDSEAKAEWRKETLPLQSSTATEPITTSPIAVTQTGAPTAVRYTDILGGEGMLKGK